MSFRFISNLFVLIRFSEWIDKVWIIFGAAIVLMLHMPLGEEVYWKFVVFFIYTCFALSYGYTMNTYADKEVDIKAGKSRKFEAVSYFSQNQLALIIGLLGLGMLVIPFYFDNRVKALGIINFLLATFYSLKPIRFKERGFWAIVVVGGPQRAFIFLFFALITSPDFTLASVLFVWLALTGMMMEIGHQIKDYERDKTSMVKTWTTSVGVKTALIVGNLLLVLLIPTLLLPFVFLPFYNSLIVAILLLSFSSHSILYYFEAVKKK